MKYKLKKIAVVIGVVLGVLVLVGIGLRVFFPADKVKEMAVTMAADRLGREVAVGQVTVSLRGGLGVRMQDFSVANPPGFTDSTLLSTRSLDLKLKIRPLFSGNFRIDRLVIDEPVLHLVKSASGQDNYTFTPTATESPAPKPSAGDTTVETGISFDRLEIRNGLVTFRDEAAGTGLRLVGVKMTAGLADPGPGLFASQGFLATDSLIITAEQPVPPLTATLDYDVRIDTRSAQVDIVRADLDLDGIPLALSGKLAYPNQTMTAQGRLEIPAISLAQLLERLPAEQARNLEGLDLTGQVGLESDVDYDRERDTPLSYTGTLTLVDLILSREGLEGDLKISRTVATVKPDRMQVETSGGFMAGQPFEAQVQVQDFSEPQVSGNLSGNLDLALMQPYLPPEKQGVVAGQAAFTATFSGPARQPEAMDYNGTLATDNLSYTDPELPDNLEQLTARVRFDPDQVVIERCEARFASGRFRLNGTLSDPLPYFLPPDQKAGKPTKTPHLAFELQSPRLDVDRMFPPAAPAADGSTGAPTAPPATRTAAVDSSFPNITCDGTFRADTLIYSQVTFTDIAGRMTVRDRKVTCENVTGQVYRGTVKGSVGIDLNDLNAPRYTGNYQAQEIEVDNFVTRFAGMAGIVFGSCSLDGSFDAAGRDPDAIRNSLSLDAIAGLTSGKVVTTGFVNSSLGSLASNLGQNLDQEQGLKDLFTHIKVDGGRVHVNELTTRLGSLGDLTLDGHYGFNGDLDYGGLLLLSEAQTTNLFNHGGVLGTLASLLGDRKPTRVGLPIFLNGTRDKPHMGIDFAPLTKQLQDSAAAEAEDKLKEEGENALKDLLKKFK